MPIRNTNLPLVPAPTYITRPPTRTRGTNKSIANAISSKHAVTLSATVLSSSFIIEHICRVETLSILLVRSLIASVCRPERSKTSCAIFVKPALELSNAVSFSYLGILRAAVISKELLHESSTFLPGVLLRRDVTLSPSKWARQSNIDTGHGVSCLFENCELKNFNTPSP
jgi:hypothetical protein